MTSPEVLEDSSKLSCFEQVPQHTVTLLDDGLQEKLQIVVRLPGVGSVSDFVVKVQSGLLRLHAPGRYLLELPLDAVVDETPEQLKYVRNRCELKAVLRVVARPEPPPMTAQQAGQSASAASVKPNLHESFLAEAAKLRDNKRRSRPASAPKAGKAANKDNLKMEGSKPSEEILTEEQAGGYSGWERPRRRVQKHSAKLHAGRQAVDQGKSSSADSDDIEAETDKDEVEKLVGTRESQGESESRLDEAPASVSSPPRAASNGTAHSHADAEASTFPAPARSSMPDPATAAEAGEYEAAKRRANEEASEECLQRASDALEQGDHDKALRLARKAAKLYPSEDPHSKRMIEFFESIVEHQKSTADSNHSPAPMGRETDHQPNCKPATESRQNGEERPRNGERHQEAGPPSPRGSAESAQNAGRPTGPAISRPQKPKQKQQPHQKQRQTAEPAQQQKREAPGEQQGSKQPPPSDGPPQARGSPQPSASSTQQDQQKSEFDAWYDKVQKQGRWRRIWTLAVLFLSVAATLALRTGIKYSKLLIKVAPNFLLNIASYMRWNRVARFLTTRRRQSWVFSTTLTLLSAAAMLSLAYVALNLSLLLLQWMWGTLSAAASATIFVVDCLLWSPGRFSSCLFAFGLWIAPAISRNQLFYYLSCFWSWPLLMLCMRGGLMGILTLPYCFYATVSHVSQLNLLVVSYLTRCAVAWMGCRFDRLLSMIAAAIYLVLHAAWQSPSPAGSVRGAGSKVEVPEGAEGEIARVLKARDHYEVLQVPMESDADLLRRAKRAKALATHPDKVNQALGSNQAFARVTEAHDVLSNPAKRAKYNRELAAGRAAAQHAEEEASFASSSPRPGSSRTGRSQARSANSGGRGGSLSPSRSTSPSWEAPGESSVFCHCGQFHSCAVIDRPMSRARYCAECDTFHPADEGDGWLEAKGWWPARRIRVYVALEGEVRDMTEWITCMFGAALSSSTPANAHKAAFNLGSDEAFKGRSTSGSRKKGKGRRKQR